MSEKFYCVGCKEHYELDVTEAVKKPSKGGSYRHSLVSQCPKGHKTTKICKQEVYETYSSSMSAEDPLTAGPSPAGGPADITPAGPSATPLDRTDSGVPSDFEADHETFDAEATCSSCGLVKGEKADINNPHKVFRNGRFGEYLCINCLSADVHKHNQKNPAAGSWPSEWRANEVVGTMSPGAGVNEALEPLEGGLENGDDPSLVPADSFQPQGNGHVIGQNTDSYNTTPMHAEEDFEPYFELCIVSNGTVGDIVEDYDEAESEKAFIEWENHVNEDGPHVLIFYDSADESGMIVAGDDFMEVYDSESLMPTVRSNRKALMASAAAALVIGLVWYRSSRSQ